MAEADVSKMPNGVKLNGDHSQVKAKHMATAASSSNASGPESNQCRVCSKRVYEMEKLVADNMVYHKTCFKCCKCTRTLRVGNYASMDAQIFCKPHFIECFKQKGNYEEGFGKERHKNKWLKSEDNSENEAEDHDTSRSHSAEKSCTTVAAATEHVTVSAAAISHSAPPAAVPAATSIDAGVDLADGHGVDDHAAAVNQSKGEPIVVSVNEKKSKFFQAVAESAKPKEHKPEPGRLKSNAWSAGRTADDAGAQPSASSQRLAADGLVAGKSAGIGDKKSLFETPASGGAPAAAPLPKSSVTLRPRRVSPVRSSESWRRSASVDDYDGRWSHSAFKASGSEESAAPAASGERQSRSTTRAPLPGRSAPADARGGEPSIVEQKRKAFQQRQNTEPTPSSASLSPGSGGGSSLKHKMEEFERRSAEQAEAARRDAKTARTKSEHEEPVPSVSHAQPKLQQMTETDNVGEPIVVAASASGEKLECAPPSVSHNSQPHPGQPLAAVPEETVVVVENSGRGSGNGSVAGGQSTLTIEVGEDECFEKPDALAEPFVKEIASIKSKFEAGGEVDAKPDSYRSAAREEVDVIRSVSGGSGGVRSRYERALEETSRKQPPKLSPHDQTDGATAADCALEKPVAEVASLKSRFESGVVVRDSEPNREESPAARLTSSGTARLRYQKALEESTTKPVPKAGLTDVPAKTPGAEDDADQAAADEVGKQAGEADSGKLKDVEFHLVAIGSLKSKFEAGGASATEQPPRSAVAPAIDADVAVLQGGNVLARYQKALEESSSKPVAKTEVPTPTRSASVRVRPTSSSADAVDAKPLTSPVAAAGGGSGEQIPVTVTSQAPATAIVTQAPAEQPPRSPLRKTVVSTSVPTTKEAAHPDVVEETVVTSAAATAQEAVPPPVKDDASRPKEPAAHIRISADVEVTIAAASPAEPTKQRDAVRPADIQLQAKDTGAAVTSTSAKSPTALSPAGATTPAGTSQLHRIMNKFQSGTDVQPAPLSHGSRPEPKPLKIPNFEARRPSADSGDTKAHQSITSPPFWATKGTKSLKERFEAQELPQSGSSRGISVDLKRRPSGPSSDDGSQSTAVRTEDSQSGIADDVGSDGRQGGDDNESIGAVSSSVDPVD